MTAVLRVMKPGLLTTVQDLGRPNAIASGVPPGGAMDRFAHSAANLLVGNDPGAATLECTLTGPQLLAERSCLVAITGADFEPRINDKPEPAWTAISMREGDRLTFGGRRSGARAYISVAGGIAADRWLGSLSTYLLAKRGGLQGRMLATDDVIRIAGEPSSAGVSGRTLSEDLRPHYHDHTLHAIPGPHIGRLGALGQEVLFHSRFTVSQNADRMGYRLEGPHLDASGEELLSFGLAAGAIQLPNGGSPILLMADHQTAGGYPVVATVASADLTIAAQLKPGDELGFEEITIDRALQMREALRAALDSLRD